MYMGAITIFLFLLGLFILDGKEKWWLLAATLLAVGLGLGRNFMWLTELFFDHVPMYNKFRTVSMALVLLQFTLPMLGFLALDRILKAGCPKKKFLTGGVAALVLTAGFCLLVYAFLRLPAVSPRLSILSFLNSFGKPLWTTGSPSSAPMR